MPADTRVLDVDFHSLATYLGGLNFLQTGSIHISQDAPNFKKLPFHKFRFERHENNDYVRYDAVTGNRGVGGTELTRFLRFSQGGSIELADSYNTLRISKENLIGFNYIGILGLMWQLAFFAGKCYREVFNYTGGIELVINIIGTSNAVLANYAKNWESPFKRIGERYSVFQEEIERLKCLTQNIRIAYRITPHFYEQEQNSHLFIEDLGRELQRCFNESEIRDYHYQPNTKDFPWQQYYEGMW